MEFIIRLKAAHDQTGLSPYAVHKQTGIAINTIVKYTSEDEVKTGTLWPSVIRLAEFYGLDWRDPRVIGVVEEGGCAPEMETPLALPA